MLGSEVGAVDDLAKVQAAVLRGELDVVLERKLADGVPLRELIVTSIRYEALSRLLFGHGLHP